MPCTTNSGFWRDSIAVGWTGWRRNGGSKDAGCSLSGAARGGSTRIWVIPGNFHRNEHVRAVRPRADRRGPGSFPAPRRGPRVTRWPPPARNSPRPTLRGWPPVISSTGAPAGSSAKQALPLPLMRGARPNRVRRRSSSAGRAMNFRNTAGSRLLKSRSSAPASPAIHAARRRSASALGQVCACSGRCRGQCGQPGIRPRGADANRLEQQHVPAPQPPRRRRRQRLHPFAAPAHHHRSAGQKQRAVGPDCAASAASAVAAEPGAAQLVQREQRRRRVAAAAAEPRAQRNAFGQAKRHRRLPAGRLRERRRRLHDEIVAIRRHLGVVALQR